MAQSSRRYYTVGDYVMGRQIGSGSFSTVWHARHRVHGTEVAIKEIITARLNSKLQESLKSEIVILKGINHPNIIRLHHMIEEPGKIFIVLEYCKGGDLSMYIQQRQGKIPEATAKHFMKHLAEGLKVLRDNNLIHRDLKPQNLLLSTNEDSSILKIADFGFARSLQPRGLAETLCGSPLYMAPEIMQLQKYDAKADLWSVGAILFQLVTGRTPFTGSNQIQLLQNIIKSGELQFPPEAVGLSPECIDLCRRLLRRNPVERLTFEEFFNHLFLSGRKPTEFSRQSERLLDEFSSSGRTADEITQEDCLPFSIDYDSSGPDGNQLFLSKSSKRSMHGFSLDSKSEQKALSTLANRRDSFKDNITTHKTEIEGSSLGSHQLSEGNLKESLKTMDLGSLDNLPKVVDSLESIDQDYVFVSGPPLDLSSSACPSKTSQFLSKTDSPLIDSGNMTSARGQMPAIGRATGEVDNTGILESRPTPSALQGSMDITNTLDQPSTDCMTRIKSLQHYASSITDLVSDKIRGRKLLEAFSIQLVLLALWKQALQICHTYAASVNEVSSSEETSELREASNVQHIPDAREGLDISNSEGMQDIISQIERTFLHEVGNAEELSKMIDPGNMEMPDAMDLIYQSALALGKRAAVDEYLGEIENAVHCYSKAVCLLMFILVEASCLILNPPFSLTSSDRYRIQSYIDILNNRQSISQSQIMAIFKADEDRPCPS
ncbi:serine/threonine-protein kinase ATG1c-like isoform X2 [Andrographis paniculata]|uniref:serine/threonine-protein kinase ATG1c-like isoform X2 n=1 Tax=Andrographis paniculata TaxID=175694 RepID=UPI0021E73F1F|nr:serine/threonine-protein kinase ATG1c-like isoform X2 [Andrographis paniculata]